MQPLRTIGQTDEFLTQEQGEYINNQVITAAQLSLKGYQLFTGAIRNIDPGAQSYSWDSEEESSPANIDWAWPGRMNLDTIKRTRKTIAIPLLHAEAEINKLDLLSSRMTGTPLNTSTFENRARQVAKAIDEMLILGWSEDGGVKYQINGLYTSAGNDIADILPFSTATNIKTALDAAVAALLDSGFEGPYNLTLNPVQFSQLSALIGPTTGDTYRKWLKENPLQGGQILASGTLPSGKGLVTPANPQGSYELILAEDLTIQNEVTTLKEGNNLFGRIYFRGLPAIYQDKAICRLSAIG